MKRAIALLAAVFLNLGWLCSICPAADEQIMIAVLLKGMSNPYWKTLFDGVNDKAKALGLKVYVQGIQSDADSEGQLNMCNTMLIRKPKALIFGAVNNVNLAPCLRQAGEMGIKLVDVDGGTGQEDAAKMGLKVSFSVASNNYELGRRAAQYLSGLKGKVLLIEGFPGSVPGELRKKGFSENLPPGLEIAASLPGNWDRLKAADITNGIIMKHPDLAAVFAANDLMALGAAEALMARGTKSVKVVGIDGIADAVKAIKQGRLTASIAQLPYLMGSEALEKTYKFLSGRADYEYNQNVPIVTLDQDVLSKGDEPLLQFVK
jgi:D-allose transport system substrate-binding protein